MTGVSWREVALCICAACLLMVIGACLAVLALRFVPAFFMLLTQLQGVTEFI